GKAEWGRARSAGAGKAEWGRARSAGAGKAEWGRARSAGGGKSRVGAGAKRGGGENRAAASCAGAAKTDRRLPTARWPRLAARGGDGRREAVMHPAGEHLHGDCLGPGWAYLLQVAAFDPAGQLGQRRFQDIQIADHAPVVELLAIHHDLNPVVMIMQLPLWS